MKNTAQVTKKEILNILKEVNYPGFNRDIVSFGMVKDISIHGSQINISLQINSENDDIVVALHAELRVRRVVQLIEAPGFLEHLDDDSSVLRELQAADLSRFESQAEGRIKRKLRALKDLIELGGVEVILSDGRTDHPIRDGLSGKGTLIR